jgi:N-acetylglucosaminyldiphosphoundecaprenol N-acetyl-beta-D-mannosaminyltransferase
MLASVDILGVPVHDVTHDEAVARIESLIEGGGAHQVATVNPEFVMTARRDSEFQRVLRATELNVPDGAGVLWAARRKGTPLRERVAGVDLVDRLCGLAASHGWRAYFLGAQPGVAERAAAALALRHAGLKIAGTLAGSPGLAEEADIVARLRSAGPKLLFVAYGAPAQDKWLARNLPRLNPDPSGGGLGVVGMGVGGAFDFIAGLQRRAPEWMQQANLEWLYRLVREPRRWRRQTALVRFAAMAMLESR